MQVIHYPDDPRPARWHQPVLALGNFDGMHRGHLKIIERVRRGRRRARIDGGGDDVRSASVEDRPPRQGASAADDAPAEARGAGARRHARRRDHPIHAGAGAVGSGNVRAHRCSSSGCTSPKSGWAQIFCSGTIARATSRCCAAWARGTDSARRKSTRSATRTSSSAARACAG